MMAPNLALTATLTETSRPVLTVISPSAHQRLSNTLVTVTGTAGDNWQVTAVWCQIGTNTWWLATTTNHFKNWSAPNLSLTAGTNLINAYALNLGGNDSVTNTVSVVVTNVVATKGAAAQKVVSPTPSARLVMTPRPTVGGRAFSLQITGVAGGSIEVSTNLTSWETLTNFTGTNTTINVCDPAATNFSSRFYRAVGAQN